MWGVAFVGGNFSAALASEKCSCLLPQYPPDQGQVQLCKKPSEIGREEKGKEGEMNEEGKRKERERTRGKRRKKRERNRSRSSG